MKLNDRGVISLSELMIVILFTGFFVTLILRFSFGYWRYGYSLEVDQETLITRLNASDYLREKLGTSSGLIIQNGIEDANTENPDSSIASGLFWEPLHAIPRTTTVTGSGTTPLMYFKRYSADENRDYIMNGSQPYEDEYILYINNDLRQLLVRTLAHPSAPGNALLTSCPPEIATASCPADKVIASNLSSIDTQYFSRSANIVDYTSSTDPDTGEYTGPDFPVVEVVELNLHLTKKAELQKTTNTINEAVIRVALRNI